MSVDKIMAVTIPLSIAAVFLGMFSLISGCQEREKQLRTACIAQGGTVISQGANGNHCIMTGKVDRP